MGIYSINGENAAPAPSLSMFQSIGIIGDSFASGEIFINGTGIDYYDLSWGQVMARMAGSTAVNYSKGGLTTKTWLTDTTYGLAKLNAEPANQLYIIALGINDGNQSIPIGTISDITSDSTNSFYSYYGRIIRAVKAHAPNAVIMLSTLARWTNTYTPYSTAVRAIGEYYSLPVLDLDESEFFQSNFFADTQVSNHPTAVNYSAMAKEYKRLVEDALAKNASLYNSFVG
jgi:lysophospholipase L1-like esterase